MEVNQKTEKRKIKIFLLHIYLTIIYEAIRIFFMIYLLLMLITFTANGKIIRIIDIENPNNSVVILWNGLLNIF